MPDNLNRLCSFKWKFEGISEIRNVSGKAEICEYNSCEECVIEFVKDIEEQPFKIFASEHMLLVVKIFEETGDSSTVPSEYMEILHETDIETDNFSEFTIAKVYQYTHMGTIISKS